MLPTLSLWFCPFGMHAFACSFCVILWSKRNANKYNKSYRSCCSQESLKCYVVLSRRQIQKNEFSLVSKWLMMSRSEQIRLLCMRAKGCQLYNYCIPFEALCLNCHGYHYLLHVKSRCYLLTSDVCPYQFFLCCLVLLLTWVRFYDLVTCGRRGPSKCKICLVRWAGASRKQDWKLRKHLALKTYPVQVLNDTHANITLQ